MEALSDRVRFPVSPRAPLLALSAAVALCACVAPTGLVQIWSDRASAAAQEKRWDEAYAYMRKLVANDDKNPLIRCEARHRLLLGVYAGMSCRFAEAEQHMERAHECYLRANGGLEYLASFELAELQFGRKQYPAAAALFKQAFAELGDRLPMSESEALRLDDYAVALDESGDAAGAVAVRERVYAWRSAHRGAHASAAPFAYGSNCPESSARD
jgi:tetratricopeptide (TPR) repeat protein